MRAARAVSRPGNKAVEAWPLDKHRVRRGRRRTRRHLQARARRCPSTTGAEIEPEVRLHDLRRRVVEHRYQMESGRAAMAEARQAVGRGDAAATRPVGCMSGDLAMLVNFTQPHQPLAPWRLQAGAIVAARRAVHLKAAERLACRLFVEKPKVTTRARRIVALLEGAAGDVSRTKNNAGLLLPLAQVRRPKRLAASNLDAASRSPGFPPTHPDRKHGRHRL